MYILRHNNLYMKDTFFCEAIDFLKLKKQSASIQILRIHYERGVISHFLNKIGKEILSTNGEPIEVCTIINNYANKFEN
jgi:hypothetical protein